MIKTPQVMSWIECSSKQRSLNLDFFWILAVKEHPVLAALLVFDLHTTVGHAGKHPVLLLGSFGPLFFG